MPFVKGQEKIGGRKPGRPVGSQNRRSQVARDIVERTNCDPLEFLIRVIKNRKLPWEQRIDAAKAASKFVHPVLSTSAITATVESKVELTRQLSIIMANPELAAAAE